MSDQYPNLTDDRVIVGHEDLGAVDVNPSNSGKYIATATAIALLVGVVTYGVTRSGGESSGHTGAEAVASDAEQPAGSADSSADGTPDPAPAADTDGAAASEAPATDSADRDTPAETESDAPADSVTEPSEDVIDDLGVPPLPERASGSICPSVQHQPVDQRSASGIWLDGEVAGFPGGHYIWVEAPTINNGDPVSVPIVDDSFQAQLGINSYGDHPLDTLEIRDRDDRTLVDLVPAFPGDALLTVGPDEGPLLDEPCFDFDLPVESAAAAGGSVAEQAGGVIGDDPDDPLVPERVKAFFDRFAEQHADRNAEALIFTMYGPMRDAFGPGVCDEYIRSTTGSIAYADVQSVGEIQPLSIDTPQGRLDLDQTVPVAVEFETLTGDIFVNDVNLVIDGDRIYWLTRCGVE